MTRNDPSCVSHGDCIRLLGACSRCLSGRCESQPPFLPSVTVGPRAAEVEVDRIPELLGEIAEVRVLLWGVTMYGDRPEAAD